jgi:hypothetical protein
MNLCLLAKENRRKVPSLLALIKSLLIKKSSKVFLEKSSESLG